MMKKITLIIGVALISVAGMSQTTYKLEEMTQETFAKGGDSQWSFEKYNYTSGKYSKFTTYTDSCACNYLDIYNPERLAGNRITEIDGVTANGDCTLASNLRMGWCSTKISNPASSNSNEKFVYACRDDREGFGYELFGNAVNTSVISFTAPADGYYKVDGTVIREDGSICQAIDIVPRYRYASAENIDSVNSLSTMGFSFTYGEPGTDVGNASTTWSLANGGAQRWSASTPTSFGMAYQAKAGDIISFEVNVSRSFVNTADNAARGAWSRTFFRDLDITTVDKTVAETDTNFVDPYGTDKVGALKDSVLKYYDALDNVETGSNVGQYPSDAVTKFSNVCDSIYQAIEAGTVNNMSTASYLLALQNAWTVFLGEKIITDFTAAGNYRLFYSTGSVDANNLVVNYDADTMAKNDNAPWGFQSYAVSSGSYAAMALHDTGSKFGSTVSAWYDSAGEWFYLSDNGQMHPLTTKSPAVMFTAPQDGVYKVNFACYRPNPNTSLENPLYIRCRFMDSSTTTCQKSEYIFAKEYGSVANDGAKGKAPIEMNYFVNMKQGDKLTFEEDAYTANRNSSAATQITNLSICSCVTADSAYTVATATASGLDFYNPYKIGDATNLNAAIVKVDSVVNADKDNVGAAEGQFGTDEYTTLTTVLAESKELVKGSDMTQKQFDDQTTALENAISGFLSSKIPFEMTISGDHGIRLAGTDKFLCQNNSAGAFYYAGFFNAEGAATDAARFSDVTVDDYNWTFSFNKVDTLTGTSVTNTNGYLTLDGYVVAGEDLNPAYNTFQFYTQTAGDTLFAVKRVDGLYWSNSINWSAPYNKVATAATPQYIFVLDNRTLTAMDGVDADNDAEVADVKYYTVDGASTTKTAKGFVIKRIIYTDGNSKTTKMIAK